MAPVTQALERALELFNEEIRSWEELSRARQNHLLSALKATGRRLSDVLFDGRQSEFAQLLKALDPSVVVQSFGEEAQQRLIDFCVLEDDEGEFFLGERLLCTLRITTRDPNRLREKVLGMPAMNTIGPIAYAEDDGLLSACTASGAPTRPDTEEIYVLMRLLEEGEKIDVLGSVTEALGSDDLNRICDWLDRRHHILHFNSHLEFLHDEKEPHLTLRSRALIGARQMGAAANLDLNSSFVFLNACSSGFGGYSFSNSLANFFRRQRAACIACTIGPVDDVLATKFARELYENLGKRRLPASTAFIQARQALTRSLGHPMALLYTYLGQDQYTLPR